MARDPPNPSPALLDASPHLRDLSLTPSAIKRANPVIIHPQLRDLILPLERGRVLYPRGNAIEELTWHARDREIDEDGDEEMGSDDEGRGNGIQQTRTHLVKLNFTPNCLIANKTMLAAGGQHGELYITNAPLRTGINATSVEDKLAARFPTRPLRPFTINLNLQNRSINNSMILLPTYPNDWVRHSDERRIGNKSFRRGDPYSTSTGSRVDPEGMNQDEREMDMDDIEEMDDEAMDLDEEDESDFTDEEEPQSPLTYPNTVPFLHPPRIPQLPNRQSSDWMSTASSGGPSRRAASFSDRLDPRYAVGSSGIGGGVGGVQRSGGRLQRQSFSIPRPGTGLPPIEYVTSRPITNLGTGSPAGRSERSASGSRKRDPQRHGALKSRDSRLASHVDEPRLLISNNDLSVKMCALRSVPASNSAAAATNDMLNTGLAHYRNQRSSRRGGNPGSGSTAASLATPVGRPSATPTTDAEFAAWIGMGDTRPQSERLRERLDMQRREFQRITGMPVTGSAMGNSRRGSSPPAAFSSPPPPGVQREQEERKLVRIGGSKFKCAINHSSLSPDLKNMVSVGDSEEVYLFEVVDGGREFRKVATYKGASDSGFSTAWSRDGRKLAVASQDGQVTVWDHRSSNPLAKFYSSRGPSPHSDPPSFSSDLHLSRYQDIRRSAPVLVDPVTGVARMGVSSSGREAARVVKFSPEGAPRDLLVFSEENTNIHIIDAQTLNTHVVIPVLSDLSDDNPSSSSISEPTATHNQRAGIQGGQWGISGISFDPTGQWLYSGTERTVVEWDMRGGAGVGVGGGVWDPR